MKTKNKTEDKNDGFKQCTSCGFRWSTRDQFLEDPDLELVGYQVNFVELLTGFFLFNHKWNYNVSDRDNMIEKSCDILYPWSEEQ